MQGREICTKGTTKRLYSVNDNGSRKTSSEGKLTDHTQW